MKSASPWGLLNPFPNTSISVPEIHPMIGYGSLYPVSVSCWVNPLRALRIGSCMDVPHRSWPSLRQTELQAGKSNVDLWLKTVVHTRNQKVNLNGVGWFHCYSNQNFVSLNQVLGKQSPACRFKFWAKILDRWQFGNLLQKYGLNQWFSAFLVLWH